MAVSFLKSGAESQQLQQQEKVQQEVKKAARGKAFRFWLNPKEEARATFVDGDLDAEGHLVPMRYFEHTVKFNGEWENFVCPALTMPNEKLFCPLCASGDEASLVSLFTVMDHRSYTSKKDPKKVYKDTIKLFAAKTGTFEILNKLAMKMGGLAGMTVDISRVGEKAPRVGDMFLPDPVKTPIATLQQQYQRTEKDPQTNKETTKTYFLPLDYENEITYRSPEELAKMGFGGGASTQAVSSPDGSKATGGPVDYTAQM